MQLKTNLATAKEKIVNAKKNTAVNGVFGV